MNRDETLKVMGVLKAAYPRYYANQSKEDILSAVNLWNVMLNEYDYAIVTKAVRALIATVKFPPSVAEVIESIQKITMPRQLEPLEAWGLVKRAIKNSLYNAEDEFLKLPEEIQMTIGSPEQLRAWAKDEENAADTVISSNFQRSYQAKIKSIREYAAMPQDVRKLIDRLADAMPKLEVNNERGKNDRVLPQMREGDKA